MKEFNPPAIIKIAECTELDQLGIQASAALAEGNLLGLQTLEKYQNAGVMILRAKERLVHGQFGAWLEKHGINRMQAWRAVKVARTLKEDGKCNKLLHLTEQTVQESDKLAALRFLGRTPPDEQEPKPKLTPLAKICCRACLRKLRVGQTPLRSCPDCRQARIEERRARKLGLSDQVDAYGQPIPNRCKDAYADPWIQETIDYLGTLTTEFWQKRLAEALKKRHARLPFYNAHDFTDGIAQAGHLLDQLLDHLKENRPAAVCVCLGAGCPQCRMSGLLPRKIFEDLQNATHPAPLPDARRESGPAGSEIWREDYCPPEPNGIGEVDDGVRPGEASDPESR